MSENGVAAGSEVTATVETATPVAGVRFPSPKDIAEAFAKMPPEMQQQLAQLGQVVGAQMGLNPMTMTSATMATAGQPAVPPVSVIDVPATVVPSTPATAPAATPPVATANPGPDFPAPESPPGYIQIPEAVYLWTPAGSNTIPLWALLAGGRKREGANPGRLVFKLLKPAYAFTRAGRRVVVPTGGWVMATLTDALEPFLQLATNEKGCVAMWIKALGEIPLDGGGTVAAIDARFEQSPDNPGQPRLYPRDLLQKRAP